MSQSVETSSVNASTPSQDTGIEAIYSLIEAHYNIDLEHYESSIVEASIQAHMKTLSTTTVEDYRAHLVETPAELKDALHTVLGDREIPATDDPEFAILRTEFIPSLLSQQGDTLLRGWVAGCGRGCEVYAIAVFLYEAYATLGRSPYFKIFATDINPKALEIASRGFLATTS